MSVIEGMENELLLAGLFFSPIASCIFFVSYMNDLMDWYYQ